MLLTGKLYYDLAKERAARGLDGRVALVRIEELSPFPFADVRAVFARYAGASEVVWAQEEPRNQGAWTHVAPRLDAVSESLGLGRGYVGFRGRKEAAVPAPGVASVYASQQRVVVDMALEEL